MSTAYLGIGSNLRAEFHIWAAINWMHKEFIDSAFSPIYRSPSIGFQGDDFLNLAARVETHLNPLELKQLLNRMEDSHGRRRDVPKFSDRTLDIDILLYDDLILESEELRLPRTEITRFAHVLRPLADLAPDYMHPELQQTIKELWEQHEPAAPHLEPVSWDHIRELAENDQ